MASITLNPDPPAALGATVTFAVADIPKNTKNPRVEVLAYQAGVLVYGEAGSVAQAIGDGSDPLGYSGFLLGGAGSDWLTNGGPAHCVANLFTFDKVKGEQVQTILASCEFEAAG